MVRHKLKKVKGCKRSEEGDPNYEEKIQKKKLEKRILRGFQSNIPHDEKTRASSSHPSTQTDTQS